MLSGKKRLIVMAFGVIYIIFFALLYWLVSANAGLDLVEENTNGMQEVFLKNNSARTINNVTVSAVNGSNKTLLAKINSVEAGQKIQLDKMSLGQQNVALVAEAPFYATVQKTLIGQTGLKDVFITVQSQELVFTGITAVFSVQACNNGTENKTIELGAEIDEEFFSGATAVQSLGLAGGECKKHDFSLTPLKAGLTVINFNIRAENYTESIRKEIEVR